MQIFTKETSLKVKNLKAGLCMNLFKTIYFVF